MDVRENIVNQTYCLYNEIVLTFQKSYIGS